MARRWISRTRWLWGPGKKATWWRAVGVVGLALVIGAGVTYLALPDHEAPLEDAEHPHPRGNHGGVMVMLGDDTFHYHAEIVREKGGSLRLYLLEEDRVKALAVEPQVLQADVEQEGRAETVPVLLRPVPQPGDAAGKISHFIGKLPLELRGKALTIRIAGISVAGRRFALEFAADEHQEAEPAPGAEQEALYLKPGGKYTKADIQANGRVSAAQKYQGFKAEHDLRPRTGEKVCPITETKANPKCTWIVDGKTYEFCCPPCIDEFVQKAKEQPDSVEGPDAYRKK